MSHDVHHVAAVVMGAAELLHTFFAYRAAALKKYAARNRVVMSSKYSTRSDTSTIDKRLRRTLKPSGTIQLVKAAGDD